LPPPAEKMAAALQQPKKPAGGAFGRFLSEKRPEFAAKCKGQPVTAVTKLGGSEWKQLSEAQQAPYQKKYEEAKATFEKDMAAFLASGGEKTKGAAALRTEKRKAKEMKTSKKDPNAPKKPAGGGYGVYVSENREKITKSLPAGHKMTDVGKAAGVEWKALSEAAKKPYVDKYDKKQAEYKAALAEYKKTLPTGADDGGEDEEDEEEEEPAEATPVAKKSRKAGA